MILTIGMGVDSNVLIFERINEELAKARTARAAVTAGFHRVWITIVDTHVTSLIAAALVHRLGDRLAPERAPGSALYLTGQDTSVFQSLGSGCSPGSVM